MGERVIIGANWDQLNTLAKQLTENYVCLDWRHEMRGEIKGFQVIGRAGDWSSGTGIYNGQKVRFFTQTKETGEVEFLVERA